MAAAPVGAEVDNPQRCGNDAEGVERKADYAEPQWKTMSNSNGHRESPYQKIAKRKNPLADRMTLGSEELKAGMRHWAPVT
jgi:hypothetical protein